MAGVGNTDAGHFLSYRVLNVIGTFSELVDILVKTDLFYWLAYMEISVRKFESFRLNSSG